MTIHSLACRAVCLTLTCLALSCLPQRCEAGATEDLTAAYNRGNELFQQEKYSAAAVEFQQAVNLAPAVFGRGQHGEVNLNTAKLQEFLGSCYLETFELAAAQRLFRACLAVAETEQGRDSEMALRCRSNLGLVLRRLNQWDAAEEMYLDVVQQDKNPQGRATTALNLGYLYLNMERPTDARRWFLESAGVWQTGSDQHAALQLASCQHGIGMVAYRDGRPQAGEQLFRTALQQRQQHLAANHRLVAQSQGMLAATLASQGRFQEALPLHVSAEAALRGYWGAGHVEVAAEQHELALLHHQLNNANDAVRLLDVSQRAIHAHIGTVLPGLAQAEQLRFLNEERHRFFDAIAVAAANSNNTAAVERSLDWTLNNKGRIEETIARRHLLARDASLSPALQQAVAALDEVRQRLAAVTVSGNNDEEQREVRAKFQTAEANLAEQLSLYTNHAGSSDHWVTAAEVAAALPDKAVFVEMVRLDRGAPSVSAFGPRHHDDSQARYIAWVLRGSPNILQMIDLGNAATIDAAVRDVRTQMEDQDRLKEAVQAGGEVEAERQIKEALSKLAEFVLRPLEQHLENCEQVVLCPDANLWLAPWNALPLADGRYAVEAFATSYVVSGRILLPGQRERSQTPSQPLMLADPDFDLDPNTVGTQTPSELRSVVSSSRSIGSYDQFPKVQRLPFTAQEARHVAPNLAKLAGQNPLLYLGRNAVEAVFKSHRHPQVLLLSTHGYFLSSNKEKEANSTNNPLLRCGLLLAGCNRRGEAATAGVDDGVLTGLEILSADLRGTQLAVLSACETGVGETRSGDGVAGLRQAFQLAGAEAVVSSLWNVPDGDTARLMNDFFASLADGQPKFAALRNAQLQRIKSLRERHGAAHPLKWAAFTLTGS